ncbi:thiol reductant ABC exporter subunit CydD [Pelagibacterium montanilacus]|uniref:thiol reductant ABC exporter subunit CydD n=1 Tax=Pelagibacterium montanilacus TaxID=2185280 RepID=UPI000F8D6B0B|nr:thiol reductant ABC exporter subunit CydD [Pelagibacterium montanilacus]
MTVSSETHRPFDRRLKAIAKDGGLPLVLAIAAPLGSGALLVVQAYLLAQILGATIVDGAPIGTVAPMIAAVAALWCVRAAFSALGEYAGQVGAERIKGTLRVALFDGLLLPQRGLGVAPASGATSAALVDQVEAIEPFFARYLPAMIAAGFLPFAFAVILFPIDWIVALLFVFTAPAIPLFMALAGMGAQAATNRQANALAQLSAYFADRLRGLVTLKLLGQAGPATDAVHAASEDLRRRTNGVLRIAFLSSAILEFFAALGVAGVALYVGLTFLGYLPFHPELTLASGFFCLLMAPEVYQPLRQLAAHHHDRAAARSALAEIEKQIGVTTAIAAPSVAAIRARGPIAIRTLSVPPILDGLDLDIASGKHIAIMGDSGIGKSTLLRAIAGLLPHEGEIDWGAGRPKIGYITQNPRIFFGTIADNIGFADPSATRAAIETAAELAQVKCFTAALPDGLDAVIGEGGEGLSGGQAQRVALARLFLTDPDLILLDEPTAHLDQRTEAEVLDAIFDFALGRALVIVTHAHAVAARADAVYRMAGGKLFAVPHRRHRTSALRKVAQ